MSFSDSCDIRVILNFFLWLFAYLVYMRNSESDLPNFYCKFVMVHGFFGILVIFIGYGAMSKRFRQGLGGDPNAGKFLYNIFSNFKRKS